jgi:hypothetical protein
LVSTPRSAPCGGGGFDSRTLFAGQMKIYLDFDGTMVLHRYPDIGAVDWSVVRNDFGLKQIEK